MTMDNISWSPLKSERLKKTRGVSFEEIIASRDERRNVLKNYIPKPQVPIVLTDAATIATDASLGNHFRVTLGDNRTLGNPTNSTDGQKVIWEFVQDVTGSRTITLDTRFGLGTDITAVTLTTTANKRDFMTAIYNMGVGTWYVVGFVKEY